MPPVKPSSACGLKILVVFQIPGLAANRIQLYGCFDEISELKKESKKDESIDGCYPGNEIGCESQTCMPAKTL
jgi:hypothetical protein